MSDFYRRRRVVIKDATALLTFFLGFVWSGAFVWPFLADQVDRGDMTRGLAYFLAAVLGTGLVTGMIGLETGNVLGGLWERYHKQHRSVSRSAADITRVSGRWTRQMGSMPAAAAATLVSSAAPPERAHRDAVATSVYYTEAGVYAASFIQLASRVRPTAYEVSKVRQALARTVNIGAWDGPRLVGVVRVMTDGYTFSTVADILVDPEYQRLGIGRSLMQHALAVTPDSRLSIDSRPECVGFFERVGCDRGPTGFLLTEAALQ